MQRNIVTKKMKKKKTMEAKKKRHGICIFIPWELKNMKTSLSWIPEINHLHLHLHILHSKDQSSSSSSSHSTLKGSIIFIFIFTFYTQRISPAIIGGPDPVEKVDKKWAVREIGFRSCAFHVVHGELTLRRNKTKQTWKFDARMARFWQIQSSQNEHIRLGSSYMEFWIEF